MPIFRARREKIGRTNVKPLFFSYFLKLDFLKFELRVFPQDKPVRDFDVLVFRSSTKESRGVVVHREPRPLPGPGHEKKKRKKKVIRCVLIIVFVFSLFFLGIPGPGHGNQGTTQKSPP